MTRARGCGCGWVERWTAWTLAPVKKLRRIIARRKLEERLAQALERQRRARHWVEPSGPAAVGKAHFAGHSVDAARLGELCLGEAQLTIFLAQTAATCFSDVNPVTAPDA